MKIKVSDYIVKYLEEYGIKHVFMITGGGAMHLNDSFGKSNKIQCISQHHEQACSMSAEGYARVNQELAVVNITTGPAGINCLNGVLGQWTDSVPVLYISGQVKTSVLKSENLRQLGDQEVDIINIVKSLTKYCKQIKDSTMIKYFLDKAIYEATHERFGPVWLDIPLDIQSSIIETDNLIEYFAPPESQSTNLKLDKIIEKLKNSKRPLIIVGHGVKLSRQEERLNKLLEEVNIPVVTTFNGLDIIEDYHKNFIGRIGTIGQRAGNFALNNADLILCLGTRNNIRQISYNYENFAKNAYKIVVDIDEAELSKSTIMPDLKIQADLKEFLPELYSVILEQSISCTEEWIDFCKNISDKYSFENTIEYQPKDDSINPYYFTRILTELIEENTTIVSANATPSICLFQVGITKGQRIIMNSGCASMGYSLPASIGACLANNKHNTICLEGDGSIMMNIQELSTIRHNNLPIKIFIFNNNGYGSIKQTQNNYFNGHIVGADNDSGISFPNFNKVANSFGIKSFILNDNKDIKDNVEDILKMEGPVVCNVILGDYIFSPKLSSRVLEDGSIISASLEDMYPFLDRKEFEENIIEK